MDASDWANERENETDENETEQNIKCCCRKSRPSKNVHTKFFVAPTSTCWTIEVIHSVDAYARDDRLYSLFCLYVVFFSSSTCNSRCLNPSTAIYFVIIIFLHTFLCSVSSQSKWKCIFFLFRRINIISKKWVKKSQCDKFGFQFKFDSRAVFCT